MTSSAALQDCQMVLMLLEQQNEKRPMMARAEQDQVSQVETPRAVTARTAKQDYQVQLMLLEQENEKRRMMARAEHDRFSRMKKPRVMGSAGGPAQRDQAHSEKQPKSAERQSDQHERSHGAWEHQKSPKEITQQRQQQSPVQSSGDDDTKMVHVKEGDALLIELQMQAPIAIAPLPALSNKRKKPEKYPAKTHARKVKDELGVTSGLVYLNGQKEKTWEDTDGDMPFRQRRFALYLSGANFPGIAVTYDMANDYLILWVPVRAPAKELWNGTVPSIEECANSYDVDSVRDIQDMKAYLEELVTDPDPPTVYLLHANEYPTTIDRNRLDTDAQALVPAMSRARAVKTAYEISQIRKAIDISSEAHREVLKHIKHLKNEAQVESIFLAKCRDLGAKNQAYAPICGSGPNAAVLHYNANDQDFGDRQLMVLDAGAEFNCYASDVTRTFPLSGEFSPEAKKVYQIVLSMQEECIAMIGPLQSWVDVSLKAIGVALAGLKELGILHAGHMGQPADIKAVRAFFPHGLGHLVGLDTHDVIADVGVRHSPGNRGDEKMCGGKRSGWFAVAQPAARAAVRLKEGMVITCEPGIYFNKAFIGDFLANNPDLAQYVNMALLEQYYPVGGCRLEDCILVTKTGHENLTSAPKSHEMMDLINGGA